MDGVEDNLSKCLEHRSIIEVGQYLKTVTFGRKTLIPYHIKFLGLVRSSRAARVWALKRPFSVLSKTSVMLNLETGADENLIPGRGHYCQGTEKYV